MKKVLFVVITISVVIFFSFAVIGNYFTDDYVNESVQNIIETSLDNQSDEYYHNILIEDLPFIVQNYFKGHVKEGTKFPHFVRIKQKGKFKTDNNSGWSNIDVNEYFSSVEPAYFWDGTLTISKLGWLRGLDYYIDGDGSMLIKLFSSVKLSLANGNEMDQSGLARFLTETVFFPTYLLENKNITWQELSEKRIKVSLGDAGKRVSAIFTFDDFGKILKIETKDRYRFTEFGLKNPLYTLFLGDYKWFNGFKIPTYIEMEWQLNGKTFKFGKLEINDVEYDVTEPYQD